MKKTIQVTETITMKPRGDRDTQSHPCSLFEVDILAGEDRVPLFSADCFNTYWTTIEDRGQTYAWVRDRAEKIASTLGLPMIYRKMQERVVSTTKLEVVESQEGLP